MKVLWQYEYWSNLKVREYYLLHALGTASPIAVMKIHFCTLENEGADTILDEMLAI